MEGAMEYWIKECNIDGYRCDVASMVPTTFWNFTRKELEKIRKGGWYAGWKHRKSWSCLCHK